MRALPVRLLKRLSALEGLTQDALLYLAAAAFAGALALGHGLGDYKAWGNIAGFCYLGGGLLLTAVALRHRRVRLSPRAVSWWRRAVLVALLAGAVVAPLCAELTWRAEAVPGVHAQPEVAVIERAGDRVVNGHSPYPRHPNSVGIAPSSDAHGVDATAFFPYLPGMVGFGVLNALHLPRVLRDARVTLALFTLVIAAAALVGSGESRSRRGRIAQFLIVLPSGALPMVTGGDDLPVLALMLAGLVLAKRRMPLCAGLVLGLASSMKFTSWVLAFLLAFAIRDREDQRAWLRYGLGVAAMVVPAIAVGVLLQPHAFIENVLRFPLGLTRIKSPAASPLLGQFLVSELPSHKTVITAILLVIGAAVALGMMIRRPPRTPAGAAGATAFIMALATVLAPATRFGYLIYPANLIVWALLLPHRPLGDHAPARARRHLVQGAATLFGALQPPSPRSATRSTTALAAPVTPGVGELRGSTKAPTSQ